MSSGLEYYQSNPLPCSAVMEHTFSHPVEKIWRYITDTDRMDRAIGQSSVHYIYKSDPKGGSVRWGENFVFPFHLRWKEFSYEWVLYQFLRSDREYSSGPFEKAVIHFTLSWDLLCPSCQGDKSKFSTLSKIETEAHCEACNITYGAEFDKSVELTFAISPRIREVETLDFCVGSPQNTPHFLTQIRLQPGETRSIEIHLEEGIYRIRSFQSKKNTILSISPSAFSPEKSKTPSFPSEEEAEAGFKGPRRRAPTLPPPAAGVGGLSIKLLNSKVFLRSEVN